MTGLEFLSATIGQLTWPLLVLVLVLTVREPLRKLLTRPMNRMKAGPSGIELEFEKGLQEAEEGVADQQPALPAGRDDGGPAAIEAVPEADSVAPAFMQRMRALAAVEPRSVVLEAHAQLEGLLRKTVHQDGPPRRPVSLSRLISEAVNQKLLDPGDASALTELTYLRNQVAHVPDEKVTVDQAIRYAEVAVQVATGVRLASGQSVKDGPVL